uniref:Tomoregulin-1-like n=1 Tax=Stegastes partitus TaxID=144197 RepID=A0A3B5AU28_9TELE
SSSSPTSPPHPSAMAPVRRLCCLLALLLVPAVRSSFPRSGADCGPGKAADCPADPVPPPSLWSDRCVLLVSDLSEKKSDLRVCDAGTCRFGGSCRENGADIKCVCQFHLNFHITLNVICESELVVCNLCSNMRTCVCPADGGSGSGDGGKKPSRHSRRHSRFCLCVSFCSCMCNIVCNGHNDNPVCGSDGATYDTPCHVREASCLKQLKIDIKHVGRCQGNGDTQRRAPTKCRNHKRFCEVTPAPCPEDYAQFCEHGRCEMRHNLPTCSCEAAYGGPQCDQLLDFNILYVVPSGQKLHYVLIAAIIGAVQIAVIVAVVMCFTRRCNKTKRGRRQKQHLGHFPSGTSSRMM